MIKVCEQRLLSPRNIRDPCLLGLVDKVAHPCIVVKQGTLLKDDVQVEKAVVVKVSK